MNQSRSNSNAKTRSHHHRRGHGFWRSLFPLVCPNCLSKEPPYEIPSRIPLYLFPLRLLFGTVRCNACLVKYYRVRAFNWLFRA